MRLIWTSEATDDFDQLIVDTVRAEPEAAGNIYRTIRDMTDRIAGHPFMFRRGRVEGTRETSLHGDYLLVYEVLQDDVRVLGILPSKPA